MPKKPKRKTQRKRQRRIADIGLQTYRDTLRRVIPRTVFDDMLPPEPTINRVPRPEPT